MRCGRCQAEDLHLFPICIGTLGRSGDEVTHFYDILAFFWRYDFDRPPAAGLIWNADFYDD
jgi:hypothetical protein